MKKYTFSKEICYSKRLKARTHLKYALTCSCSVLFSTVLVVGLTVGAVHHNSYTGQGGEDVYYSKNISHDASLLKNAAELKEIHTINKDFPIEPVALEENEILSDEIQFESEELADVESIDVEEPAFEANQEDSPLYYTVYRMKNGDTAGEVAKRFGISTDTILSVNGVTNATRMAVNTYLKIPSIDGILYDVSKDGETLNSIIDADEKLKKNPNGLDRSIISLVNGVPLDQILPIGYSVFLAGSHLTNDQRAEISGTSFKSPLRATYYISSPFGWRVNPFNASKRSYHNGLDMACPQGTPIYSTASGTVVTAGYTNVYGNYVIIKHTSGYKSLYGHMSVINAKVGQYVDQGTVIGRVGSTGQSTGPHLHFTIYKNEKAISPYEKVLF